jgi:two-component system chemotaxis family response regulator WspR
MKAPRVLIVDDQPIIVAAVRNMLETVPGIEVVGCNDAQQALGVAEQMAPTVILQDLVMEDFNGLELVRGYRGHQTLRNVPVVVLSAHEDASIKAACFADGANDYVVKLPSALELVARVTYHSKACRDAHEREAAYSALLASQDALEKANRDLYESAFTDPLTGLRNRRFFREWADDPAFPWKNAQGETEPDRHGGRDLIVAVLDIDHFKRVNDTYGHDAGDAVLCEVAQRLRLCVRGGDILVRWGGEEFLIVWVGASRTQARQFMLRVLSRLSCEPVTLPNGDKLRTKASIGWVSYPFGIGDGETLSMTRCLSLADIGVYAAKSQGRNRAVGLIRGTGVWDDALVRPDADVIARIQAQATHSDAGVCMVEDLGIAE